MSIISRHGEFIYESFDVVKRDSVKVFEHRKPIIQVGQKAVFFPTFLIELYIYTYYVINSCNDLIAL